MRAPESTPPAFCPDALSRDIFREQMKRALDQQDLATTRALLHHPARKQGWMTRALVCQAAAITDRAFIQVVGEATELTLIKKAVDFLLNKSKVEDLLALLDARGGDEARKKLILKVSASPDVKLMTALLGAYSDQETRPDVAKEALIMAGDAGAWDMYRYLSTQVTPDVVWSKTRLALHRMVETDDAPLDLIDQALKGAFEYPWENVGFWRTMPGQLLAQSVKMNQMAPLVMLLERHRPEETPWPWPSSRPSAEGMRRW